MSRLLIRARRAGLDISFSQRRLSFRIRSEAATNAKGDSTSSKGSALPELCPILRLFFVWVYERSKTIRALSSKRSPTGFSAEPNKEPPHKRLRAYSALHPRKRSRCASRRLSRSGDKAAIQVSISCETSSDGPPFVSLIETACVSSSALLVPFAADSPNVFISRSEQTARTLAYWASKLIQLII